MDSFDFISWVEDESNLAWLQTTLKKESIFSSNTQFRFIFIFQSIQLMDYKLNTFCRRNKIISVKDQNNKLFERAK